MTTVRTTQAAFELIRKIVSNRTMRPTQMAYELVRYTGGPKTVRPTQMAYELIRVGGTVVISARRRQGNNY